MPALGAPTAKRAVGSAVLPDNTDLDTVTVSGMYRLAAMELPWQAFSQMLVVHGGADTISQVIFAFSGGGVYVRTGNPTQVGGPGVWGDWKQLAVCTAPEVHDLPLADGWQAYGEGLCWYTRNQFKEVTIGMLLRSTSALTSDGTQFATLPEGFRPKVTVIAPANVTANDYSHSACHVTINPDGNVYLHFDASSLSGKTVLQLLCPVFHYPAK